MSYPDWQNFDEEGNPEVSFPPKEEPDCPPCGDTGRIRTRLGRSRTCPNCDPTRLGVLLATIRWRCRVALTRLTPAVLRRRGRPAPTSFDDQPPF